MPHVIYETYDDHVHVLSQHEGSRILARMTEEEWRAYWATSEDMQAYRASHPRAQAAIVHVGVGRWTRDFSAPYAAPPSEREIARQEDRAGLGAIVGALAAGRASSAEIQTAVARLIRLTVQL